MEALTIFIEHMQKLESDLAQLKKEVELLKQREPAKPITGICKMPEAEKILPFKATKIREMAVAGQIKSAKQLSSGHWYFERAELVSLARTLLTAS